MDAADTENKPELQTLYLVRHARSMFNQAMTISNEKRGIFIEHQWKEDLEVKYSEKLFDSSITQDGVLQVINFRFS